MRIDLRLLRRRGHVRELLKYVLCGANLAWPIVGVRAMAGRDG